MRFFNSFLNLRIFCFFLVVGFFLFFSSSAKAVNFIQVSDTISTSQSSTGTDHTIKFVVTTAIPPQGKIVITPEDGVFNIPADFDFSDVDFATSSSINGNFVERSLASSTSSTTDGVTVVSGTSGNITITLNSSSGIASGVAIRIKLGMNAVFEEIGDQQIQNPSSNGSYRIEIKSYDASNTLLDRATAMIAIVSPVNMEALTVPDTTPPYRYNGLPSGTLPIGTQSVSLSLNTDEWAYCRYATTAGVEYSAMTGIISDTLSLFHSTVINNLVGGNTYYYYIRCIDSKDNANTDDYLISFFIPAPGGPAGGGGAPFPPAARAPEVVLEGWAYPMSKVVALKDGKKEKEMKANLDAEFKFVFTNLEEGVYTFSVWAEDTDGRRSITDSSTFLVRGGTKTTLRILLPPTIELKKDTLNAGETLEVFGQSVPNSKIEIWIYPAIEEKDVLEEEIIKRTASTTAEGRWYFSFNTSGLKQDTYKIKARASFEPVGVGEFGRILYFGIGKPPVIDFCERSDLNKDGKVNLVDFSILLYHWQTSEPLADINLDGIVNLVDFSIMMYCWTG